MEQHEKMVGLSLWARSCCDNDEVLVVQFFNDGLPGRDALRDNACRFLIDLPPLERHHFQRDNLVVSQPKRGVLGYAERKNCPVSIQPLKGSAC
jgi:hypothetical protein